MTLTVETRRRRVGMSFGQQFKLLCVEWVNSTKATELEAHFRNRGVDVSHQAIGSYFTDRSLPEEKRLVAMMDAMELEEDQRRELAESYAKRKPGFREICGYLVNEANSEEA